MLTWNLIVLLLSSNHGGFVVSSYEEEEEKIAYKEHTKLLIHVNRLVLYVPGLGRVSANLLRLVRLSAPSWFKIPGSISVSCLFSACPVIVKVLAAKEA